eukprot:Clim_evm3s57 gene=Clim_evmTU3s57
MLYTSILVGVSLMFSAVTATPVRLERYEDPLSQVTENYVHRHEVKANSQRPPDHKLCEREDFRDVTMKLIGESTLYGLFGENRHAQILEASALAHVDSTFYVVFDSLDAIGVVNHPYDLNDPVNYLNGDVSGDSQFEGIAYNEDRGTFFVLKESIEHKDGYRPATLEIKFKTPEGSGYDILETCVVEYELDTENKGFEGCLFHNRKPENTAGKDDPLPAGEYLIGLCEGNHCKGGSKGQERGNGRMVISKRIPAHGEQDHCQWQPVKTIHIPKKAHFKDYSGVATLDNTIAITSQEDSAVWMGTFDFEKLDFADDDGEVYFFPRDANCEQIYCNIEGIQFISRYEITVVSDRMKGSGRQSWTCLQKDQSMHSFQLPRQK